MLHIGKRDRKRIKRVLRVPFEWLGIGIAMSIIPWLPRRLMFGLCDVLSAIMYVFDGRGRRRSLENLRILRGDSHDASALPTSSERKIIRRSYRNMARSVGYAFWTCFNARRRCAETGMVSDEVRRFLDENKPAITVSGHIGCWEILSQLAYLEGHQMMSVAKDIGTRGMTKLLMLARRSIGQEIVPADGAFRSLMNGLKEGKSLGLLVDQVVNPRKGGVWVRFLGRPMPVSAAPAFFAAKAKAPIIIAWSRPLKDGRYRCEMIHSYDSNAARDIWGFTQTCLSELEGVIRRHPSCWILSYNYFRAHADEKELAELIRRESKRNV